MNGDLSPNPTEPASDSSSAELTLGRSSLYKLFEAFITLREKNERQHKLFEHTMTKSRDAIQASFNSFAADTQRAYQQLRQEIHGEKKLSLALLNELLEIGQDLEHIVAARPLLAKKGSDPLDSRGLTPFLHGQEGEPLARWMDAIEVECRKVQAALKRHGIHPYDAVIASAYNPALHERVGSKRMDGMDALRIAEQVEHGYASQQPEFVLRRPKVIVSE